MKFLIEFFSLISLFLHKEERDQYNYDIGCGEQTSR